MKARAASGPRRRSSSVRTRRAKEPLLAAGPPARASGSPGDLGPHPARSRGARRKIVGLPSVIPRSKTTLRHPRSPEVRGVVSRPAPNHVPRGADFHRWTGMRPRRNSGLTPSATIDAGCSSAKRRRRSRGTVVEPGARGRCRLEPRVRSDVVRTRSPGGSATCRSRCRRPTSAPSSFVAVGNDGGDNELRSRSTSSATRGALAGSGARPPGQAHREDGSLVAGPPCGPRDELGCRPPAMSEPGRVDRVPRHRRRSSRGQGRADPTTPCSRTSGPHRRARWPSTPRRRA